MKRHLAVVLIVALVTLFSGLRATGSHKVAGDFLRYHRAGRMVATGQADHLYEVKYLRGQHVYAEERAENLAGDGKRADPLIEREFKYLPAAAVLLAPIGALHPRTGDILWAAWNGLLIALMGVAAWRVTGKGISRWWLLVPLVALLHTANDNLNLGQLNPTAIVPATLGALALSLAPRANAEAGASWLRRHRFDVGAGVIVAFGTVMKFMPLLVGLWMLWKRRSVAAAAWIGGLVFFAGVLPALVLGPSRAVSLTQEYREVRSHVYTAARIDDVPGYSIKSFVYRALGDVPLRGAGETPLELHIGVAHLDPAVLQMLTAALSAVVVLALLAATWGAVRGPPGRLDALEAGAVLTSVVLISPEARGPHFLYLTLGVFALTGALARSWDRRGEVWWRGCAAALALCAVLMNTSSGRMFGDDLSDLLSAWCAMGFGALLLFVALLVARAKLRDTEDAEPAAPPTATS